MPRSQASCIFCRLSHRLIASANILPYKTEKGNAIFASGAALNAVPMRLRSNLSNISRVYQSGQSRQPTAPVVRRVISIHNHPGSHHHPEFNHRPMFFNRPMPLPPLLPIQIYKVVTKGTLPKYTQRVWDLISNRRWTTKSSEIPRYLTTLMIP